MVKKNLKLDGDPNHLFVFVLFSAWKNEMPKMVVLCMYIYIYKHQNKQTKPL